MLDRALLIAAAASVALAAPAHACSCSNGGPRVARESSAAVFLGRVVSVAPGRRLPYGRAGVARLVATQAIKGVAVRDTVAVEYIVDTGGNCGLSLRRGMRLLVYARAPQVPGTLPSTDYCAGTKPLACAAADLRELAVQLPAGAGDCGVPRPPRPHRPPASRASGPAI